MLTQSKVYSESQAASRREKYRWPKLEGMNFQNNSIPLQVFIFVKFIIV
jgi:hypothetical protein